MRAGRIIKMSPQMVQKKDYTGPWLAESSESNLKKLITAVWREIEL